MLTPGQAHDLTCAEPLLESVDPRALLGDKAFDADPFIDALERRDIAPVIPPKANRKVPRSCDFVLYCASSASSTNSSTFVPSLPAMTNSPQISSPASSSPAP
jgi:hypothetical protein